MLQSGNTSKGREGVVGIRRSNELGLAEIVFGLGVLELGLRGPVENPNRLQRVSTRQVSKGRPTIENTV